MAKSKIKMVEIEPYHINEKAESTKTEKSKAKPKLSEIDQKVFDYITRLDHPATTNEVRDHFGFPLRANARRIFRKLEKLEHGENRKVGKRYLFYVNGKEYPEPKKSEKAEPRKA